MSKFILASQSPRRKTLLEWAELPFEIIVSAANEDYPSTLSTEEVPVFIAKNKAAAVKEKIIQDKGEIQVFRKQQHWQSSYLLLSRRRHHLYLARHYAIRRRHLRSGRQRRCVGFLNSRASLKLLYHSIYRCLMP